MSAVGAMGDERESKSARQLELCSRYAQQHALVRTRVALTLLRMQELTAARRLAGPSINAASGEGSRCRTHD